MFILNIGVTVSSDRSSINTFTAALWHNINQDMFHTCFQFGMKVLNLSNIFDFKKCLIQDNLCNNLLIVEDFCPLRMTKKSYIDLHLPSILAQQKQFYSLDMKRTWKNNLSFSGLPGRQIEFIKIFFRMEGPKKLSYQFFFRNFYKCRN